MAKYMVKKVSYCQEFCCNGNIHMPLYDCYHSVICLQKAHCPYVADTVDNFCIPRDVIVRASRQMTIGQWSFCRMHTKSGI